MPKVELLALTGEAAAAGDAAAGITIGFAAASSFHTEGAENSSELLPFVSAPVPEACFLAAGVGLADMKGPLSVDRAISSIRAARICADDAHARKQTKPPGAIERQSRPRQ